MFSVDTPSGIPPPQDRMIRLLSSTPLSASLTASASIGVIMEEFDRNIKTGKDFFQIRLGKFLKIRLTTKADNIVQNQNPVNGIKLH